MIDSNKHNTYGNDVVICPKCGNEYDSADSYETVDSCQDGDETETSCRSCGEEFVITVNSSITFTTHCKHHKLVSDGVKNEKGWIYAQCENCEYSEWLDDEEIAELGGITIVDKI